MSANTVVRAGFKFQDTKTSEVLIVNKVEIDQDDFSDSIIWYKTDQDLPYSHYMYHGDLDREIAGGKLVEYDVHP